MIWGYHYFWKHPYIYILRTYWWVHTSTRQIYEMYQSVTLSTYHTAQVRRWIIALFLHPSRCATNKKYPTTYRQTKHIQFIVIFLCNQIGMAHFSHLFELYHNVNKKESLEVWEWYGRLMGRGSHYWGSLEKSSSHRPGSGTGIRSGAPSLNVDMLRMDGWMDLASFQHNESEKKWQLSVFRRVGSWRYNTFNTFRSIFATNVGL